MTLFQCFVACSIAGGLPGFVMIVKNMIRGNRSIKCLEDMARAEGQYLDFSCDIQAKQRLIFKPNDLITEADSDRLADAKRRAIRTHRRMVKLHLVWAIVTFLGAGIGAYVGYRLGTLFGLN